jgi:hypothetical protein
MKVIEQNGKVIFELEEIFSKGIHHLDFTGNDLLMWESTIILLRLRRIE